MSGSTSNIKITISALDLASATILKLNTRVADLEGGATKSGRALRSMDNSPAMYRSVQAMSRFGESSLGAARAVERLVAPLAVITAASSLAGLVTLTKGWADAGVQIRNTAYQLQMSPDKLWTIRKAGEMLGATVDNSLAGIQKTLTATKFNEPGSQKALYNFLGIDVTDPHNSKLQRSVEDALPDIARAIDKKYHGNPAAQLEAWFGLGGTAEGFPLIQDLIRFQEAMEKAARSGGRPTEQMIEDASELKKSWTGLSGEAEGIGNRIVDSWSHTASEVATKTADWIANNRELADSYTKLAMTLVAAVGTLYASKVSLWMLRALGLAGIAETAAGIGLATAIGVEATSTGNIMDQEREDRLRQGPHLNEGRQYPPVRAGPRAHFSGAPGPAVPYEPGQILKDLDISSKQYGAMKTGVASIENAAYDEMGGAGGRFAGRYQFGRAEITETARRLFEPNPSTTDFLRDPKMQERYYEAYTDAHHQQLMEISPEYRNLEPEDRLRALAVAHSAGAAGAAIWLKGRGQGTETYDGWGKARGAYWNRVGEYLHPAGPRPAHPRTPPPSPVSGNVMLDVHFHNAPAGMRANADSTGGVTVMPPRIETPMLGR